MNSLATPKYGRLDLICGPMFAGKTSELARRITRYKLSSCRCLVIKYAGDVRYADDDIVTHDGKRMTAVKAHQLYNCCINPEDFDVIGIDEGQFFPDLVAFCKEQIKKKKIIIVAGLDGTYLRTGFEQILNLVPMATSVKKLSAICMSCGKKASFTKRTSSEEKIDVIGGIDKYMAVCRECYKKPNPIRRTPFKNEGPPNFSAISNINREPSCKRQIFSN